MPGEPVLTYSLISLTGLNLVFTFYCSVTICVSRAYAVIKHIEIVLVLTFLVCRLLWDRYELAAAVAYYTMYVIGCWTVVTVLFGGLSMGYWEKKGIGVYVFFATKIFPADAEKQTEKQTQSGTKRTIGVEKSEKTTAGVLAKQRSRELNQ